MGRVCFALFLASRQLGHWDWDKGCRSTLLAQRKRQSPCALRSRPPRLQRQSHATAAIADAPLHLKELSEWYIALGEVLGATTEQLRLGSTALGHAPHCWRTAHATLGGA
eukprot:352550-Chlamydomonas_euryale.AAC.5